LTENFTEALVDLVALPQRLGDTFAWADLVEVRCLVHPDHLMTVPAIAKMADADVGHSLEAMALLGNRGDSDPALSQEYEEAADGGVPMAPGEPVEADPGQLRDEEPVVEDPESPAYIEAAGVGEHEIRSRLRRARRIRENIRNVRPVDSASPADRRHVLAADIVRVLEWRAEAFGEDYPFLFLGERPEDLSLVRRPELSERHYVYLFLLMCASFPLLESKADEAVFSYPFERFAALALKRIFPAAEVRIFGTSERDDEVPTALGERIEYLARVLRGRTGTDVAHISRSNTGDGGLDVFVHTDLGDTQEGRFVVFGQAACTDDWVRKQSSASAHAWRNTLILQVPQVSVCAIPMSFRRSGGDWHDLMKLQDSLILDRSRLMHVVQEGFAEVEAVISSDGAVRALLDGILAIERS
jgi:hypothetical protein